MSADHSYLFTFVERPDAGFPLVPGEFGSLYMERGADYIGDPSGHFQLTGCGALGCEQYAQGRYISRGGHHVIFTTGKSPAASLWCNDPNKKNLCKVRQLESEAAPTGTGAVYDREIGGATRVASLLPGNETLKAGEEAFYQGCSADGRAVAFTVNGVFYVRLNNEKTEEVTSEPAEFGGFSTDGRYLFFVTGGNIHRFDTSNANDEVINASSDAAMMNVSEDGSHMYFISPSQLDGLKGSAGQPNMYLWSEGATEFIATLNPGDLTFGAGAAALGLWTHAVGPSNFSSIPRGPGVEASRTTSDGSVVIFESSARLTSYDNTENAAGDCGDPKLSGDPCTEVYRYAQGGPIECVSCDPSGTPPTSDARLQAPGDYELILHNLSDDGSRVFFETKDGLVAGDVDALNDSYEWRLTPGVGAEPEIGLISSGTSLDYPFSPGLEQNTLLGISRDGRDAYFKAQDALVPGAGVGGAPAIYDARIDGGFPKPPPPPAPCLEEGCKPPAGSPPVLGQAASSDLSGAGNVVPKKKRRHHRHSHRRCAHPHSHKGCPKKRVSAIASGSATALSQAESPTLATGTKEIGGESGSLSPGSATPVAQAGGEFEDYGIKSVSANLSTTTAGRHPDFTTKVVWNKPIGEGSGKTKTIVAKLPPGLIGNPNLTPRCTIGQFLAQVCPLDSQVGLLRVEWVDIGEGKAVVPFYNLAPPHPDREIAKFGFSPVAGLSVALNVSVRTAGDYGVTATIHDAPAFHPLAVGETTIWGDPADHSHDKYRMTVAESLNPECGNTACKPKPCNPTCSEPCDPSCFEPGGENSTEKLGPVAFFTNPSACQQGTLEVEATSYQLPGQVFGGSALLPPITDCQGLPFAPEFTAEPTAHAAGAPTGLHTVLKLPQSSDPAVPGTAPIREARVTLPEGMTISAGAGDGLQACSEAEVHFHEEVNASCPDASKLGTVTIVSPALTSPLEGAVYQRSPRPGHLFGLWLVVDRLGLHVKLPGEIEPDPKTGQLTAVFTDLPQVPVEEIDLDTWGGPRAALKTPDACGTHTTAFSFSPHSQDPAVTGQTSMTIDQGCGPRGFDPKLGGGVTDPKAGGFSTFVFDLLREDGEQDLAGFKVTLPEGVLAKVKGVPLCPDAAAASGACPGGSRIGSVAAAAGPGPNPLWLPQPGKDATAVYFAGPYNGAPYSVVSVVPAQAGPFDLGNVVVRSPLRIDPETAKATVEAEPLPQIIAGVPVSYRRLHVVVDRPEFTLNPTNCSRLAITSEVSSVQGAVAHPSVPFEVDGCKALKFQPRLKLKLKGGTKRADYPALIATLKARRGDANLGKVSVALPHSEFLAQEHIGTICTRVQFAAHKCPKASVYGSATAWSPLLDKPLKGPIYLRSSSHPLPDLVLDLKGQIEVAAIGRIDSKNGGIRNTFEAVPDAPVSKIVVRLDGGRKGLLTNSQNICAGKHRATVRMKAQNGRALNLRPALKAQCGKKK